MARATVTTRTRDRRARRLTTRGGRRTNPLSRSNALLVELDATLRTLEFEERGALRVAAARWDGRGCELLLDIRIGDDAEPRQAYRFSCTDVRPASVGGQWSHDAHLHDDHPLLLRHASPQVRLAFRGRAADPRAVVGALWQAHVELLDDWEPLTAFLNTGMPLAELLGSENGILADGPRVALERYAAALAAQGVEPSFLGERQAARWTDRGWEPEPDGPQAFVVGDDYVVGTGFRMERVPVQLLDANA